jgi:hypothetical protein
MGTRIPTWAWFVAGGGLLAMTFIRSDSDVTGLSDKEIDALARMLIVEHFGGVDAERAQILWVALNRAKNLGVSPISVVSPGTRKALKGLQGGTWNGSEKYRLLFEKAINDPRFPRARDFVKQVLAGKFPNKGFTAFIHPAGMPQAPCEPNRKLTETFVGPRCMPEWAKNPARIGIGYFYA